VAADIILEWKGNADDGDLFVTSEEACGMLDAKLSLLCLIQTHSCFDTVNDFAPTLVL
jgi:hypothetical protein